VQSARFAPAIAGLRVLQSADFFPLRDRGAFERINKRALFEISQALLKPGLLRPSVGVSSCERTPGRTNTGHVEGVGIGTKLIESGLSHASLHEGTDTRPRLHGGGAPLELETGACRIESCEFRAVS